MKVIHDHLGFLRPLVLGWFFRLLQEDVVEGRKRNRKEKMEDGKSPLFLAGWPEGRAEEGGQFVYCWKPLAIQGTFKQRTTYLHPTFLFRPQTHPIGRRISFAAATVSASEEMVLYCTTLVGETAPTKQGAHWRCRGGSVPIY